MITLTLHCCQCPKSKTVAFTSDEINVGSAESLVRAAAIERGGIWIVQNNGGNIDTYCSKKCAA